MGRVLGAALLGSAIVAATAGVAGAQWRELPAYAVPGGQSALCLRPAGDGALTIAGASWVRRLALGPDALAATEITALGRSTLCPEPAGGGSGATALLAGPVAVSDDLQRMAVSVGGGPPQPLGAGDQFVGEPSVAVAAGSGAAVVAWNEWNAERRDGAVLVTVRPSATAPFGPPQRISAGGITTQGLQAVVDDAGRAHLVWSALRPSSTIPTLVASAPAGGRFSPGRVLTTPTAPPRSSRASCSTTRSRCCGVPAPAASATRRRC